MNGIIDSIDMNLRKLGDCEGQGNLVCCTPWGHKELDTTYQLDNNKDLNNCVMMQGFAYINHLHL